MFFTVRRKIRNFDESAIDLDIGVFLCNLVRTIWWTCFLISTLHHCLSLVESEVELDGFLAFSLVFNSTRRKSRAPRKKEQTEIRAKLTVFCKSLILNLNTVESSHQLRLWAVRVAQW
jgi:hypothetical protein